VSSSLKTGCRRRLAVVVAQLTHRSPVADPDPAQPSPARRSYRTSSAPIHVRRCRILGSIIHRRVSYRVEPRRLRLTGQSVGPSERASERQLLTLTLIFRGDGAWTDPVVTTWTPLRQYSERRTCRWTVQYMSALL